MFRNRKIFAVFLLVLSFCFANQPAFASYSNPQTSFFLAADKFYRIELYFGINIKGGGKVSEKDWGKFLETVVTPRFPDGFTILDGYGQFKNSAGKIVREESKVLILFYPKKQRASVNTKIEEIRAEYKKLFNQESVLRLDFVKAVKVSF